MVRQRAWASARDWYRMVELRLAARAHSRHADHLGDLLWSSGLRLGEYDPARDLRLWEWPDGALAAYAALYPVARDLAYDLHPRARTPELEEEVLAWGVERMSAWLAARPAARREHTELAVRVWDDDAVRLEVQTRLGFERTPGHLAHLVRPLALPIPAPSPPRDFTLRHLEGEHEAPAYVEAHRDAWEGSRMDLDRHRWLMGAPGYRRDLNLVAVAPDGTFAATLIGWLDPANRAGEIEPLGVRPAFRRLGLGRAIVLEALWRFQRLGATVAEVWSVGARNPAATALYAGLGFREAGRALTLRTRVPGGSGGPAPG